MFITAKGSSVYPVYTYSKISYEKYILIRKRCIMMFWKIDK